MQVWHASETNSSSHFEQFKRVRQNAKNARAPCEKPFAVELAVTAAFAATSTVPAVSPRWFKQRFGAPTNYNWAALLLSHSAALSQLPETTSPFFPLICDTTTHLPDPQIWALWGKPNGAITMEGIVSISFVTTYRLVNQVF